MKNPIKTLAQRMKQFSCLLPWNFVLSDEEARQMAKDKDQAEKVK